jgi:hypothetical protein
MKRLITLALVFHASCLLLVAQDATKSLERDIWRARADRLTSTLLKDASNKDALDRALLLAQLSDLWWESEQNQATAWIERSVDTIDFYPSAEAKEHREKFLRTARQVLALISTRNKKQSARLVEILSKPEEDVRDSERQFSAQAIIEQALKIVKADPAGATKLGLRAFTLGFPSNAWKLALDLRRQNPNLADQIVSAAFSSLSVSPDIPKLYGTGFIVFPEVQSPGFPAELIPPRQPRMRFLNFVADYLYQRQLKFSSKAIPKCSDEAILASRLKLAFSELLPQKSEIVEQSISICITNQTKQLLNPFNAETSDVDELLTQVDRIQDDPLLRGNYLFRAVLAAREQKKFATGIDILEKMTDDERKVNSDFWEDLRTDLAARLAVAEFKEGDVTSADKTLKKLSDALRPLGQINFVYQFSPQDEACSQFCVDLLHESRRELSKSELLFPRKSSYWLNLVKMYSGYKLQTEAAETFKEMVIAFNSFKADDGTASTQLLSESKRIIPDLSLSLFETKEDAMLDAVKLINDQKVRSELNLQFLKVMLEKYRSLKRELEKEAVTTPHIE